MEILKAEPAVLAGGSPAAALDGDQHSGKRWADLTGRVMRQWK
jgi:hypothetical protein